MIIYIRPVNFIFNKLFLIILTVIRSVLLNIINHKSAVNKDISAFSGNAYEFVNHFMYEVVWNNVKISKTTSQNTISRNENAVLTHE